MLNNCRCLKIVYLQCNLIRKIENLHRLKELDYLNIAMNNITKIENLERCEALVKLDMTCNFVDLDELHSVGSLKNNTMLRELYLTGNPCQQVWESGYRDYVIATLPQLANFDGKEVLRAERIRAMQRLPELEAELVELAKVARQRKAAQKERWAERQRKIDAGELEVTSEATGSGARIRIADSARAAEIEEDKVEYRPGAGRLHLWRPAAARAPLLQGRWHPVQMNTAKWPFSIEEDGQAVYVNRPAKVPQLGAWAAGRARPRRPRLHALSSNPTPSTPDPTRARA